MGEQDVADQQGAFSRRGAGPPFSNGRDSRLLGAATPVGVRVSPVVHLIGDPLPWFIHTFESCPPHHKTVCLPSLWDIGNKDIKINITISSLCW